MLNSGDVILPEYISANGKLIIKELTLPECFKDWDHSDYSLYNFMNKLYKISKISLDEHAELHYLAMGLYGDDPYIYECLCESLEKYMKDPLGFIKQISLSLDVRIADLWFGKKLNYDFLQRYSQLMLADMLVYNGKNVSEDKLPEVALYFNCLYFLKGGHFSNEFVKGNNVIFEKIKELGIPTEGFLSWAVEMAYKNLKFNTNSCFYYY